MPEYTSLAKWTLIVSWTLTALGFLSTSLNVLCARKVGVDVALVVASLVLATVLIALSTWAIVDEGQGMHDQDVSSSQLVHLAKSLLVAEALWSLVNGLIRISACILLRRVFMAGQSMIVCMLISGLLAGASLLQVFLLCRPFAANWDKSILSKCGDQVVSFMVFESLGLALDVAILVYPAWRVMSLKMTLRNRLAVIFMLDAGIIVLVVSAFRMKVLYDAISPDFYYSTSYMSLLSAVGTMLGIICCGLPALRAMMAKCCLRVSNPPRRQVDSEECETQSEVKNIDGVTADPTSMHEAPSSQHDDSHGSEECTVRRHAPTDSWLEDAISEREFV